ncbi:hypothetical protein ACT7DN_10360 [Bacillus paranthracis]
MSHVLEELDEEVFLQVLPHLRLLFSQFTPVEVDTIARHISKLYGDTEEAIKRRPNFRRDAVVCNAVRPESEGDFNETGARRWRITFL